MSQWKQHGGAARNRNIKSTSVLFTRSNFWQRGNNLECIGPAMPAVVLGLNGAPQAGDRLRVMLDEKEAKKIISSIYFLIDPFWSSPCFMAEFT